MQEELHQEFADWVRFRRGWRLDSKAELFTGEVWTGKHAQAVGLLDGLGTLRGVVGERYPHARVVTAQPHKPLLARLGAGGGEMAARFSPPALLAAGLESAIEALEARGHWSRFGL
jgi:ClpP class serine protease